jgi:phage-related baseplate assembly protein
VRYRCQLALEGMTVAGPRGAYRFHALSASANVLDVKVTSPQPGTVRVYVMDARSNGVPDQPLLDAVLAYLSDETRIPLCDSVEVQAGQPRTFTITARLERDADLFAASGGLTEARRRLDAMLETRRRLGELLSLDDIIAAISCRACGASACPPLRQTSSVQMVNSRCASGWTCNEPRPAATQCHRAG